LESIPRLCWKELPPCPAIQKSAVSIPSLRAACPNLPLSTSRDQFANLARTWIRLADEIERTEAFLATLDDETEPISKPVSS
jgi:hypothetical protein